MRLSGNLQRGEPLISRMQEQQDHLSYLMQEIQGFRKQTRNYLSL